MCLGVPAKVIEIHGQVAILDLAGNTLKASLDLLDNIKIGDYVLLHAGYAIQKLDEDEAQKTLELIELLGLKNSEG